jgi:aspartate aminotransferase-like enzyme
MHNTPILLTPGPVPIPQAVLSVMGEQVVHHRTPGFEATLKFCLVALKRIFDCEHVLLHVSTGSGGMESALVNTLNPGDEVLAVVSGKFGERWADMAELYGAKVERLDVPWGEAVSLVEFTKCLEKNPNLKAVLTQACETSTASLHPIKEMSTLVNQKTKALFMVDAITAAGCMDLPMAKWGVDVVIAGSQKAFMLPTGMSFVGISKRAHAACEKNKMPRFFFDWREEIKANAKNVTFFSSPSTMIRGLAVVLDKFEKVGIAAVQKRCETLAQATREAAVAMGLDIFSKAPAPSVTAITLPENISGEKLRDWLESERGVIVMGGQEKLKNKILRVGHMGDIRDEDMTAFFRALNDGLTVHGAKSGSFAAADAELKKILPRAQRIFA